MNGLTTDFVAHLIAKQPLAHVTEEWIAAINRGSADDVAETVDYMAALAREWTEFSKGIDLSAAAYAYRQHVKLSMCPTA